MKCEHTPGRSCSSTSGALAAKVLNADENVDEAVKCSTITFGRSVCGRGCRSGAWHTRGSGRGGWRRTGFCSTRCAGALARRRPVAAPRPAPPGHGERGGGGQRPGRQLDDERARAGERVVLPARGGAVVVRERPRGQADAPRVGAHHPRVGARREVHQPHVLVVPDGHRRADPLDEPPHRARLRLGERSPAREVGVERAPAAGPAAPEVAVEVDAARVLPRAAADAVGVDGVDEPQLDALRRRRRRSRASTARPAVSLPWIEPTTSTFTGPRRHAPRAAGGPARSGRTGATRRRQPGRAPAAR